MAGANETSSKSPLLESALDKAETERRRWGSAFGLPHLQEVMPVADKKCCGPAKKEEKKPEKKGCGCGGKK